MKKLYLITLICLVALLSLSLVACDSGASDDTTAMETEANEEATTIALKETSPETEADTTSEETSAEETTVEVTETTVEETTAMLYIAGTPISEYTVVYKISPYSALLRKEENRELLPVYDFDHESADRFAALIKEYYGVELKVYRDSGRNEGEHEILIGKTNRDVTGELGLKDLATDDYLIKVNEGQLVICGGAYGTTWHALDALEALIAASVDENGKAAPLSLDENYSNKGEYHLTQIGCIGDSITDGIGATEHTFDYPTQLGRFLWKDAIVHNFGLSGTTMRSDFPDKYTGCQQYRDALTQAGSIDVFYIMLGTNDSHRQVAYGRGEWGDAEDRKYIDDCKFIMNSLKEKNEDVKFVVGKIPACYHPDPFGSERVRELSVSMIPELNEAGFPTESFDMYSVTKDHADWFPDQLHPNNKGYLEMGRALANFFSVYLELADAEAE